MPAPTGPVTLGDLIREAKLLWVYCCDCYRERDVNPRNRSAPARDARAGGRQEDEVLGVRLAEDRRKA
jgi:hypothetical protein